METTLCLRIPEADYDHLIKTAGDKFSELTRVCDNIREGVFKEAHTRGLSDEDATNLFRICLIKHAAEHPYLRELISSSVAALATTDFELV